MNNQHEKAIAMYQDICNHYLFTHQAWGNMGLSLAALGKKKAAISAFEQALHVRSDYDLARRNLEEIKHASPEQLRTERAFIRSRAGILDIGITEFALDELMDILTTVNLTNIPALRDVHAWLDRLENQPSATGRHGFIALDTVHELNALLTHPDPAEQTFPVPGTNKAPKPYPFEREPQFPTVWRLHHLLETAKLIRALGGQLTVTENIAAFRQASPAEQYAGLLWKYFHDLSWIKLEKMARPDSELTKMDQIQSDMINLIHSVVSRRLGQLMDYAGIHRQWVDPLETANLPQTNTQDSEKRDAEAALMTMYMFNEERYLWQPLAWFGLVDLEYKPWFHSSIPVTEKVRPTPLGANVLPSLSRQEEINDQPSAPLVGRNDPCPCGATRPDGRPLKYKKCHGR